MFASSQPDSANPQKYFKYFSLFKNQLNRNKRNRSLMSPNRRNLSDLPAMPDGLQTIERLPYKLNGRTSQALE